MKKILILLGIFICIILAILVFWNKPERDLENKNHFPQTTPTPTGKFYLKTESILPMQDASNPYLPIQFITLTFNFPVSPYHFYYKVDPFVEAVAKNGDSPNIIILSPKEKWQEGITSITILQNTMSTNGVYLEKPVVYKIKTAFPKGGV